MKTKPIIAMVALLGLVVLVRLSVHHRDAPLHVPMGQSTLRDQPSPRALPAGPDDGASTSVSARQPLDLQPALTMALQQLAEEADPDRQSKRVQELAETVAEADLPSTLNALACPEVAGPGVELRQLLLRRWTATAPGLAAAWAAATTHPSLRSELLPQVAAVWAESDLTQAVEWFKALPDEDAKDTALLTLAYEASRDKPVEALNLAVERPAGRERDQLLEHAVRQWSATDAHAAFAWATSIQDQILRNRLLAAITTASAELFPVESATLSVVHLAAPELQEQAVASIVQRWVQTDPVRTADWITRFPEGRLREACARNLVEIWSSVDPQAAAQWLSALPVGSVRDTGLAAFARVVAPFDLSAALAWIDEVEDPLCRALGRESVLRLRRSGSE